MFFIDNRNTCIYFDKGKIDKYCVYINGRGMWRHAPTDIEYFTWILELSDKYGVDKVWSDFNKIYEITGDFINYTLAEEVIYQIDKTYDEDTLLWWIVFYMTMVAECKKERAILKKRIKRLGVYNVLIDKWDVSYVAQYMRHKHWKYLAKEMKERDIC